jgi:hypothetical protein
MAFKMNGFPSTNNPPNDNNPPISSGTQSEVEALQGEGFTKKIENGKIVMTRPIKEGGGQTQVDVKAPKAISGGTPGSAWDNKMKSLLAGGTSYEELAKKGHGTVEGLKKRFPDAYKPKMEGQPEKITGEEKLVIGAVETEQTPDPDNTGTNVTDTGGDTPEGEAPKGSMGDLLAAAGGLAGGTKMSSTSRTPSQASGMPTSSGASKSQYPGANLRLNKQDVIV